MPITDLLAAGETIDNIILAISVAASGTDATLFKVAVLDSAYKVLAQSINLAPSAAIRATGKQAFPLSSQYVDTLGATAFYIGVLQTGAFGTTQPTFVAQTARSSAAAAAYGANARAIAQVTGQTDFPANGSTLTGVAGGSVIMYAAAA
jgi:hypothetical protein